MSGATPFLFHRPALASSYAEALQGGSPFDYRSGLFLAAPRRTGKSTFLRDDLVPEFQRRGLVAVYVDLWSDRQRDPASLIADAIKSALRDSDNWAVKALKTTGLTKVALGPFASFDIDKIGTAQGATLTDALRAVAQKSAKHVALIIDEAQHALSSEAGANAMFALKAARDAMNQGASKTNLALVFTGSHRDKLSNLMLRRDQPFFGASFLDFPLLGRDFTDAYTAWLNERLAKDNHFDAADVHAAFQTLGHRPELLLNVLKDHAFGTEKSAGLKSSLADTAKALRERLWEDYDRDLSQLNPLQRAVLHHLIKTGEKFAPYSAQTLDAVSLLFGQPVANHDMQSALEALRQKNIIWRSARATYTLEDQAMAEWFLERQATS